jgi:hypothetical protein
MAPAFVSAVFGRAPLSPLASRRLWLAARAACGVFLVFLFANLLSFRFGRDQGIYAVVGDAIVQGKAPYKDAWDFKPPAVFFVFALARALFGAGQTSVRIVETLAWATVPLAFARFVRRRGGDARLGFVGGVLAVYIHVRKEYWHTSQPESFAVVLLIWALVIVDALPSVTVDRRALLRWFAAGALFSAAGLFKPPLGGGIVLLLPVWLWERRASLAPEARVRAIAALGGATIAGGLLPVLLTWAYFAAHHATGALVDTLFVFAPHYTKLDTRPELLPAHMVRATQELLFFFTPMLCAAALVVTPVVPKATRQAIGVAPVLAVIASPWFGIALQGKFFPYHYDGCLPFVCLFATAAYVSIFQRLVAWRVPLAAQAAAFALVLLGFYATGPYINPGSIFWDRVGPRALAWLYPSRRHAIEDAMTSEADVKSAENRRLSDWLRAEVPADASVFIWGFEPVVYGTSGRRPATRFIYDVPQRVGWSRPEACAGLEHDLEADPPAVVAVEHDDRFRAVTGVESDSAEEIGDCAWMPSWLAAGYAEAWSSAKFTVYVRREASAAHTAKGPE